MQFLQVCQLLFLFFISQCDGFLRRRPEPTTPEPEPTTPEVSPTTPEPSPVTAAPVATASPTGPQTRTTESPVQEASDAPSDVPTGVPADVDMPTSMMPSSLPTIPFSSGPSLERDETPPTTSAEEMTTTMAICESTQDFNSTWDALISGIETNAFINIVQIVDHEANAKRAGLVLEPNRVVIFGNPSLGTPLMVESRTTGLDLPQKIQVWEEENGIVKIAYNPVEYLVGRHNMINVDSSASAQTALVTIAEALGNLAASAAGRVCDRPSLDNFELLRQEPGIITTESNNDFDTTVERLETAIGNSPASVLLVVDHSASSSDGALPPTKLLVFGNPNVGTPLMQAQASAGLDLPLKMLVYQDDIEGRTLVSYNDVDFLQRRHGLSGVDDTLDTIRNALANFATFATSAP